MPLTESRYWTADDVRELPEDGTRYECIEGMLLVTPVSRSTHQSVVEALFFALRSQMRSAGPLRARLSPSDVEIEAGSLVQPDIFVPLPRHGIARIRDWTEIGSLLLAIEVLSPATARIDRGRKREFYQRARVAEYWIVDPDARLVERWRPDDTRPEVERGTIRWRGDGAEESIEIDLQALFAEALDQ